MTDTTKLLDEAIDVFKESIVQHVLTLNAGEHTVVDKAVIKRDVVKTILAALNFTKAMQPRPISEAPRDGTRLFIYIEGAIKPVLAQYESDGKWWTIGENVNWYGKTVTHFTPLPDQALKELEEALND